MSERARPSDSAGTATAVFRPPRKEPLPARVVASGARATPATLRLGSGACTIGSAEGADLVIADPTISRAHVELTLDPEGVAVRDLGSRNGTFWLGQRIEKLTVPLGASIALGPHVVVRIEADSGSLDSEPLFAGSAYRGMVGASVGMRRLFAQLQRLEGSLVTVLVDGESGAGKELVAEALHEGSRVSGGPFIVLNCGAIPQDLIASELFGHKKGAFTGAVEQRRGAFEAAEGGTLFLDEIGELPLAVQPSLLRALEKGEVRPVGADKGRVVKTRVVAATNRDLEEEVAHGRFREDLFFRLAVVRLRVPPLRERPEDIPALAKRFAEEIGLDEVPADVLERLRGRSFSGNVRELRNAVHAYAALGVLPEPSRSKAATLGFALDELVDLSKTYAEQKDDLTDQFTRAYLKALLARTAGNQTVAARIGGLDRTHLGRLLAKYGFRS